MGKFLDQVLEISANMYYNKAAITSDIITNINEKIKECATLGYTKIKIIQISCDKIPMIRSGEQHYSFELDEKYIKDKFIYDNIIKYYRDEGFYVPDNLDIISWSKQLEKYLNNKQED